MIECLGVRPTSRRSTLDETVRVVPIRTSGKRILIVDDNAAVCAALRYFFEHHTTMEVSEAHDGAEAVALADAQEPDVVIMDLVMPDMNGVEAAAAIRSHLPNTLIVVFTLHSDVIGEMLAKAIGVDVVVSKSEGADGLIRALEPIWTENSWC